MPFGFRHALSVAPWVGGTQYAGINIVSFAFYMLDIPNIFLFIFTYRLRA